MAGAVGRPRKNSPKRRGGTAREEILDAAAELFTQRGFATTSTHQIAEAVGIRQASLYYHFPSKTEIFLTLLSSTVTPALSVAEKLSAADVGPAQRLWALVAAESRLLLTPRWNLGRLYQLPIAASEEFADFHAARETLRRYFAEFAAELIGEADPRVDLPFQLAQAVTQMRANDGTAPWDGDGLPPEAIMVADAALKILDTPIPAGCAEETVNMLFASSDSTTVEDLPSSPTRGSN